MGKAMAHDTDLIETESQLIERMTRPSPQVVEAVRALDGDILILGVGGKMGPTLAELMVRAGCTGEVVGVARFSDRAVEENLQGVGVRTVRADLLEEGSLANLPDAPNVFLLAGFKFGATGKETMTWAPGMSTATLQSAAGALTRKGSWLRSASMPNRGWEESGWPSSQPRDSVCVCSYPGCSTPLNCVTASSTTSPGRSGRDRPSTWRWAT